MFDKPIAELDSAEQAFLFPLFDALAEEVVAAHEGLRAAEAKHCYALSGHCRIFAAANRIPRHFKANMLAELKYVGLITGADVSRLLSKRDGEIVAELRAQIAMLKDCAEKYNKHTELIVSNPIVAIVTKEGCRIDSDTIEMFQALVDEHLHGMNTHGYASGVKPTWRECYDWVVEQKDNDGRPKYCRSLGSPFWTAEGVKRYFQAWCRHFGFTPKEITSENRPDLKAILKMRGLPLGLDPMRLESHECMSDPVVGMLNRVDELCESDSRHYTREESLRLLKERRDARRGKNDERT